MKMIENNNSFYITGTETGQRDLVGATRIHLILQILKTISLDSSYNIKIHTPYLVGMNLRLRYISVFTYLLAALYSYSSMENLKTYDLLC